MSTKPPPPDGGRSDFQAAPTYGGEAAVGGPPPSGPPPSIIRAKYAMWAGAVVQLLAIPVALLMRSETREVAEKSLRDSGVSFTAADVDAAVMIGLVFGVVMSVIGAVLWLLVAHFSVRGKGWARIVAAVLYGLFVLSFLVAFAQPNPVLTTVLNVVVLILGGVATFFLWRKDSTAWFRAHKAPAV